MFQRSTTHAEEEYYSRSDSTGSVSVEEVVARTQCGVLTKAMQPQAIMRITCNVWEHETLSAAVCETYAKPTSLYVGP